MGAAAKKTAGKRIASLENYIKISSMFHDPMRLLGEEYVQKSAQSKLSVSGEVQT